MKGLEKKALSGIGFLIVAMAAALFLPAGTWDYWQGWTFLGVLALAVSAITVLSSLPGFRFPTCFEHDMKGNFSEPGP